MKYEDILRYPLGEYKRLRNLIHLLQQPYVEALFKASDNFGQCVFIAHVENADLNSLRAWIKRHKCLKLEDKTIDLLRLIAKDSGIKNYSRMTKDELIEGIRNEKSGHVKRDQETS